MNKFKKTYYFSIYSSLYISVIITALVALFFYSKTNPYYFILFFCITYLVCYTIIQFKIEKLIYERVKKIYDEVSLLENTSFQKGAVTTDIDSLAKEVEKYAKNKKIEIETLKGREKYRKEFIGNVAHELKTPLFTVQSYIETLLDGASEDKELLEKYLTRANKGVDRLLYIVNDLDMITKLEIGNLNLSFTKFDIVEVIQSVFDLLEMKASKNDITLTLDKTYTTPIYVYADKERIQQVVINLVVNSIKYGSEGGTTEVSVESLTNSKIIVRITDNGEGIEHKYLTRIFARFYRVDKSGSRDKGGSGLGLSIVKHIIEAHLEKIYVESQVDLGSEFSFTLEKIENKDAYSALVSELKPL